ncbi:helix-turn-helix domain-containing protein [Pelagibius sp. Alg239-R121]|uniref:AraC family transcriptional regulator n=1 Tax=Pelagibius sp. Alg239-R121 TaxID=2993448 RepID=UPI0024A79159|nr:helix-turn-helix transcriptional regulator [Pelagibius sp. Alg239-R121]
MADRLDRREKAFCLWYDSFYLQNDKLAAMSRFTGLASEYSKGAWIEPHRHDEHQIVHARSGVMRVKTADGSWVLPPGRALWVPAGCFHEIYCRDAVSMRTVYLKQVGGAGKNPSTTGNDHAGVALPESCAVWRVSPLMREIIIRMGSDRDRRQDQHLLALLLSEIETIDVLPLYLPEPGDLKVRRITRALLAKPADEHSLEDWAELLGISPRTLIRRFQAETGMTFRQWRRQARLLAALEYLAAGAPVTSVAYDVGYEGLSAFIEAFRQAFGMTPGQYFRS